MASEPTISVDKLKTVGLDEIALSKPNDTKVFHLDRGAPKYFPATLRAFYGGGPMPLPLWENIVAPQIYPSAPIYLAVLRDCYVTPGGVILTSEGRLLEEGMHPFSLKTADPAFFQGLPRKIDGSVDMDHPQFLTAQRMDRALFAREFGESGFFHLMSSLVPRILMALSALRDSAAQSVLGKASEMPILFEPWTDIGAQAMDVFGFARRVLRANGKVLRVRELYFPSPSQIGDSHFTRSANLLGTYDAVVDNALTAELPSEVSAHNGRLYVSRGDAPSRRLTNEAAVLSGLSSMQFRSVESSKFALRTQIALFKRSYVVVAAHGAGLANIIFMKPGSLVIEIFPPDRIWPSFRVISALRGLEYLAIVGNPGQGNGDFSVDPELVDRIVSSMVGDYSHRIENQRAG
jgi:glycosyl transferase family 61